MSLDALGAAIQLERARSVRRPAPGAAPQRTREHVGTSLAPFDEDFERASGARAHQAEVRRTEIRSRVAAHHLDRIFDFSRRLEEAEAAVEQALGLAEKALGEDSLEAREELAVEADDLLAVLQPVPAPEGPLTPVRDLDFSTPESTDRSARNLESFRRTLGRSSGQLLRLRDLVLDNVSGLARRRGQLRGGDTRVPSPTRLRQQVAGLQEQILSNPRGARQAQANLPRGMVLMMVRGR